VQRLSVSLDESQAGQVFRDRIIMILCMNMFPDDQISRSCFILDRQKIVSFAVFGMLAE
jgi:hypothetical protein